MWAGLWIWIYNGVQRGGGHVRQLGQCKLCALYILFITYLRCCLLAPLLSPMLLPSWESPAHHLTHYLCLSMPPWLSSGAWVHKALTTRPISSGAFFWVGITAFPPGNGGISNAGWWLGTKGIPCSNTWGREQFLCWLLLSTTHSSSTCIAWHLAAYCCIWFTSISAFPKFLLMPALQPTVIVYNVACCHLSVTLTMFDYFNIIENIHQ